MLFETLLASASNDCRMLAAYSVAEDLAGETFPLVSAMARELVGLLEDPNFEVDIDAAMESLFAGMVATNLFQPNQIDALRAAYLALSPENLA